MCLDVLRALRRDEEAADLLRGLASDVAPRSSGEIARVEPKSDPESEATARVTVGRLAALAAAAALNATAPSKVADAFVETRLVAPRGALYGTSGIDAPAAELILQRALPEL